MKKIGSVLLIMMMVLGLTGCLEKTKKTDNVKNTVVENTVTKKDKVEDKKMEVVDTDKGKTTDDNEGKVKSEKFSEYSLKINILSTDTAGKEYSVKTKIYKKGDKSLYVIEEMKGPQQLPFTPLKNLLIGKDLYTLIEMKGEKLRFKAPGGGEQAAGFFDLEEMQASLETSEEVEKKEEEEVDGKKMTCYYMKKGAGKACLKDGIFAYGEDVDVTSGMKSILKVSEYKKSVEDSIFSVPSKDSVKDISELTKLFMPSEEEMLKNVDIEDIKEKEEKKVEIKK